MSVFQGKANLNVKILYGKITHIVLLSTMNDIFKKDLKSKTNNSLRLFYFISNEVIFSNKVRHDSRSFSLPWK